MRILLLLFTGVLTGCLPGGFFTSEKASEQGAIIVETTEKDSLYG